MSSTPAQITAVAFHPRGQLFVAGLVDGQCLFYNAESMNFVTAVKCRNRCVPGGPGQAGGRARPGGRAKRFSFRRCCCIGNVLLR